MCARQQFWPASAEVLGGSAGLGGGIVAGELCSEIQPTDAKQYVGYLAYSAAYPLGMWEIAGHPFVFALGGGLSSSVGNTDFNVTDLVNNYTFYDQSWYWSHSLNVVLRFDYQLAVHQQVSLHCTVPVVGLVSRPENGHWLNANNLEVVNGFLNAAKQGKAEFVWSGVALSTQIEYRQRIGPHLDLLGTYWFGYASSDKPSPMLSMEMYMNRVLIGIEWLL